MTPDEYRRRAINAEQRSAGASIPEVKSFYDDLARYWRVLADQAERFEKRYGAPVSAGARRPSPQPGQPHPSLWPPPTHLMGYDAVRHERTQEDRSDQSCTAASTRNR